MLPLPKMIQSFFMEMEKKLKLKHALKSSKNKSKLLKAVMISKSFNKDWQSFKEELE